MLTTKIYNHNITNLELGRLYEIILREKRVFLMRTGTNLNSEMVEFVTGIEGDLITANCYLNQMNGSESIGYLKFVSIPVNSFGPLSVKARQTFEDLMKLRDTGSICSLESN